MQVKIRVRSGTSEEWAAKDPVLLLAEPGYDSTTRTLKIGDGASKWSELPTTVTTDQIEEAVANSAAVHNGVHGASHAGEGVDAIPAKTLTAARDLNTLTTTGVYIQGSSAGTTTALGYPVDGFAGEVTVTAQSSGAMVMQRATYFLGTSTLFGSWIRTRYSNTWSPWIPIDVGYSAGRTSPGQDLNDLTQPGTYLVGSNAVNLPQAVTTGHVEVMDRVSGDTLVQRFTGSGATGAGKIWTRTRVGTTWSAWSLIGPQTAVDVGAIPATPTEIGTTTNLNDVTTPGTYNVTALATGTLAKNYPHNNFAGMIEVSYNPTPARTMQRATFYRSDTKDFGVYVRSATSGNWGAWTPAATMTGSGAPPPGSGVVGSEYYDFDATNGASVWRRASSGWVIESGDTGWRNVASLADSATFDFATTVPGGSYLRWRRIGSVVHLAVRVPLAESAVGTPLGTRRNGLINGSLFSLGTTTNSYISQGYVDISSIAMCSLTNSSTATRLDVQPISATGNVSSSPTSRVIGGTVSWVTNDAWPTTLPGTPV